MSRSTEVGVTQQPSRNSVSLLSVLQKWRILFAIGFAVCVGGVRWIFECLLVVPLVPDPQSAIWIMFSSVTSVILAVTIAPLAWCAFRGLSARSMVVRWVSVAPVVLLLAWYSTGFFQLARMRIALLDSANPQTHSERLRQLADFAGGPGYEIDNRVAKHHNTPPDVLRSLHGRPGQIGTEICLAQNPNTPDDVLIAIAGRKDKWSKYTQDALNRNPRYTAVLGVRDWGTPEPSESSTEAISR
ncbi:hypothetical protein [Aureliella helgolandensis]|uniref:Uncharacterized protein n=1 Tax=Aureliella helgolandensis TaxID=2527968 RepID=A0A518GAH3_9BACT|nr:hypothetical protein [Aureliella helgolandensis]QDV25596.1 hypothetical protein Q31a_39220 [Aureliella helgolandensis]